MKELCGMTFSQLKAWMKTIEEKDFVARQLYDWVFKKGVLDLNAMTNLRKELREKINGTLLLRSLELQKVQTSDDGETYKFLWKMRDGSFVESVLILSGNRRTVCVSSQVGCPAKCAFCASGKQGFKRNLSAAEIVEQLLNINKWLEEREERVSHIVFMGMGEPLKNYDSVMQSIRVMCDPEGLGLSQRRITVSTVGVVEGIKRLSDEDLKVSLVLSLHAPNQEIRKKIIPYARKYPLDDILAAMELYGQKTKRDITYEYTLISGINDHPDHAFELANLLRGKQCTVNLIPYNPVAGIRLKRPDKNTIKHFRSVLFGCNINNTCRYTKGVDIAAACGQLSLQEKEKNAGVSSLVPVPELKSDANAQT